MSPFALILLVAAQITTGTTVIQVVDSDGLPVPGLTVKLEGCVAGSGVIGVSDGRGQVPFAGVSTGVTCRATVSGLAGMRPTTTEFTAAPSTVPVRITVELAFSEQV